MKKSHLLHPLAIAISLLSVTAHAQETHQNFSQVIIFGDSLSDTGRIKATVGKIAPPLANKLQLSFTTNPDPVWASILAGYYGQTAKPFTDADKTGTNFAVGGARSGEEVNWNGVITVPSTSTQIKEYLTATSGKTDPNALYAVWIGSNDLIAAANAQTTADAQKAIANSVRRTVVDIATLSQAGASVILVPNVPDLSLTPRAIFGESVQAGVQQKAQLAAKLYNQGLYTTLNGMNANIIPANTFALLQEATTNKEAFGFKNVNGVACQMPPRTAGADDPASTSLGCTRTNLIEPNANETYAFADDIHPSGKTHRILAQYYYSLIESPTQMASIIGQLSQSGTANHQNLYRRLNSLDATSHSVWLDGSISNIKTSGGNKLDQPTFTLGFDYAGQHHHTGVYLSYQKQDHNLSTSITADSKETGFGLYHQHNFGNLRLNANASIGMIDLETHRNVMWDGASRSHTANATGRRYHAGLQVGYGFEMNNLTVRPYVGVNAQSVQVKSFMEDNASLSTALQYDLPTQKSTQGSLGLDIEYQLTPTFTLNAGVGHTHEFNDDDMSVGARLPSIPEYHRNYTLPVAHQDTDSTYGHLGVRTGIGRANITAGLTANHTGGDTNVGGYAGVQVKF